MRWLVTGGAGFVGSHVVDGLLARDLGEVVVLDNLSRGRLDRLSANLDDPRVQFFEGDIRDLLAIERACIGVDFVIHLAASSSVMAAEEDSGVAVETNVAGTLNVLQSARVAGAQRLVFSSSREVYGDPATLPVRETCPVAPKNLYGASKVAGEAYCHAFEKKGLDIRVLRLTNIYGPRDSGRVVPRWLARGESGASLTVFGGRQVLDLLWVEYAVDAIIAAATVPVFAGPVNVASGTGTPILELAERIIALTGRKSSLEYLPAREEEVLGYVGEVGEMQRQLGVTPPEDPLGDLWKMTEAGVQAFAR